jgi:hypothetical protein
MNTILKWVGGIVAAIAALTGVLYSLQVWPFTGSDQPILISDSSVDVQLESTATGDKQTHVAKGRKVDHVDMVGANGTTTAVCPQRPCRVIRFLLDGDATYHEFDLSESGSDTALAVDIGWDSSKWKPAGTKNPKLPTGHLIDDNGTPCAHCVLRIHLK